MLFNFVNLAKTGLVLPAAVSSLWLVNPVSNFFNGKPVDVKSAPQEITLAVVDARMSRGDAGLDTDQRSQLNASRARIENILGALDRIAEMSLQMKPERASQLEPVILDLAEQAMALSGREVAQKVSTSNDLDKIEKMVGRLFKAVSSSVEPEASL